MGIGDQIIATGLAKGAAARGKRIAFGSEHKKLIVWDYNSELIFRNNPNIAFPGQERGKDIEWIQYFKGYRQYNRDSGHGYWIWNMDWRCIPGEIYLSVQERDKAKKDAGKGFIVLEPNVEAWKKSSPNKDWGNRNYAAVATRLIEEGYKIVQFEYYRSGPIVRGAKAVRTSTFREAAAIMQNAILYLGPEGGLHHCAAAVGIPAVVLFGGFIPPQVTGYDTHINLAGSDRFCGQLSRCQHCIEAMANISVDRVYQAVRTCLEKRIAAV